MDTQKSMTTKKRRKELARRIDHTILRADASAEDVRHVCSEAKEYGFASVCVNPSYVELAAEELKGTDVAVCTVVGFPLGASTVMTKALETAGAVASGADEVDMVINIGAVKSGDWALVERDINAVMGAASEKTRVKVIIETCLLDDDEKVQVCRIAKKAGANFVKTSTGFSSGGATVHDVKLMREAVGRGVGVKAAGGIHSALEAFELLEAGARTASAQATVWRL